MTGVLRRFARDSADRKPLGVGHWAKGQATMASTRVMTLLLFGALAYAVLVSTVAAVRPTSKPADVKVPVATVGPEGVATLFVDTWLRAAPDQLDLLAPYMPAEIPSHPPVLNPEAPPPAIEVHQVTALSAELVPRGESEAPTPGYWSVLVGADVSDGVTRSMRYVYVPVARISGRYVVVTMPAPTAAPLGGVRIPSVAVGSPDTPSQSDPIAIAVTRFLGAMLTGQGDVSTFSAPGSDLRAIKPAPFASIELLTIASNSIGSAGTKRVEVAVSVSATDTVQHNWTLAYSLELAQRDGRWEVALLRTGPRLALNQPDLTPAPTAPRVPPVVSSVVPTTAIRPPTTVR